MDFSLTDAEREPVSLCRDFAQKEIAVRAPEPFGQGAQARAANAREVGP